MIKYNSMNTQKKITQKYRNNHIVIQIKKKDNNDHCTIINVMNNIYIKKPEIHNNLL